MLFRSLPLCGRVCVEPAGETLVTGPSVANVQHERRRRVDPGREPSRPVGQDVTRGRCPRPDHVGRRARTSRRPQGTQGGHGALTAIGRPHVHPVPLSERAATDSLVSLGVRPPEAPPIRDCGRCLGDGACSRRSPSTKRGRIRSSGLEAGQFPGGRWDEGEGAQPDDGPRPASAYGSGEMPGPCATSPSGAGPLASCGLCVTWFDSVAGVLGCYCASRFAGRRNCDGRWLWSTLGPWATHQLD
jgi:hypothetical protein